MTLQPGKQTIQILILSDISKCKRNLIIKFGQLIEYNMSDIFLEKSCTKCVGEASHNPFLKNQNWPYLLIDSLKFHTVCFHSIYKSRAEKICWR